MNARGPGGFSHKSTVTTTVNQLIRQWFLNPQLLCYTHTEYLPRWQTGTYPQQAVSYVSDHLVDLVSRQQLQREGAPLVLYEQLLRGH